MAKRPFTIFKQAADKLLDRAVRGCPRHRNTTLEQAADKVARLFNKTFAGATDYKRWEHLKMYLKHENRFSEFSVRLVCKVAVDPELKLLERAKTAEQRYLAFQYTLPMFVEFNVLLPELGGSGRPLSNREDADLRLDRLLAAYRQLPPAYRRELFGWTLTLIEEKKLGDYWLLADFCERLALGKAQPLANLVASSGYDSCGNHTDAKPFRALAFVASHI